jgi:hypothetical protein
MLRASHDRTYLSNAPGVPLSFDVRELMLPEYLLIAQYKKEIVVNQKKKS